MDKCAEEYEREAFGRGEERRKADVWRRLAVDKETADLHVMLAGQHLLDDSTDSTFALLAARGYILTKRTPVRERSVRMTRTYART